MRYRTAQCCKKKRKQLLTSKLTAIQGCRLRNITRSPKAPNHEILVAQHLISLYVKTKFFQSPKRKSCSPVASGRFQSTALPSAIGGFQDTTRKLRSICESCFSKNFKLRSKKWPQQKSLFLQHLYYQTLVFQVCYFRSSEIGDHQNDRCLYSCLKQERTNHEFVL